MNCRHCGIPLTPDVKSARSVDQCVPCYMENSVPNREDHLNLAVLIEKSQQCAAYLKGGDTADAEHPFHIRNIQRAMDRAKDIVQACEKYLEYLENVTEPEIDDGIWDGRDFDEPYATEPEDRAYGI